MYDVYQDLQNAETAAMLGEPLLYRFQLEWTPGRFGLPGIDADLTPASADDLADGATQAELDLMNMTDKEFELLGTNCVSACSTYNAEGGITITTTAADADQVIVLPHLNVTQTGWTGVTWGTDQQTRWSCRIRTGTAAQLADCIIWAGLKLTNPAVTITDADQVFFRYENDVNNGEWQAVNSIGGVDDAHDTNWALAAATEYHLLIDIDDQRVARFFIDGVLVETSAILTNAIDLIPYIGIEVDGVAAGAKALHIRKQAISRVFA